jgi:antitoxin PrlF
MNARKLVDEQIVRMTTKGQVLVHKALRDHNGFVPGGEVRIGRNERGETVIRPLHEEPDETPDEKRARIRAALEAIAGKYGTGRATDDVMRELRGDWEP